MCCRSPPVVFGLSLHSCIIYFLFLLSTMQYFPLQYTPPLSQTQLRVKENWRYCQQALILLSRTFRWVQGSINYVWKLHTLVEIRDDLTLCIQKCLRFTQHNYQLIPKFPNGCDVNSYLLHPQTIWIELSFCWSLLVELSIMSTVAISNHDLNLRLLVALI